MIKNTKQNLVYISAWFYSSCMAAVAASRGTERNQALQETAETEREKCCSGGGNVGERPILRIFAVSNRCQSAPIKEESTSLKHCSFIRP